MNRTITYNIGQLPAPMRVSTFLKQQGFSTQTLIELKKNPETVWLDGQAVYMNQCVHADQTLTVHILETGTDAITIPVELPVEVMYEDEDIVVVNKPAGMPTHISVHNYDNTLANALAWRYREEDSPFVFRCTNRLDRDTSGLTVVAKNRLSAAILGQMVSAKALGGLEAKGIHREYLGIVKGSLDIKYGVIDAPLSRKPGSILERQVDWKYGDRAVTHYHVVAEQNGYSLLALQLETGRTHQIRVHLKYIGYPLIGDYLYNPDMERIGRQALHAWKLAFQHPLRKIPLEFEAPLPEDMKEVLNMCE